MTDTNTALTKFDPVAATIAQYKEENANLTFNYEDKQGNKLARSHVSKLRKVKTAIAEVHKEVKQEALDFGRACDKKKNEYTAEIDAMIEVHAVPIKEIENREHKRAAEAAEKLRLEKEAEETKRLAELEAREEAMRVKEQEAKDEADRIAREQAEKIAAENKILQARQAELDEKNRKLEAEAEAVRREKAAAEQAKADAEEAHREQQEAEHAERLMKEEAEAKRVADVEHRKKVEQETRLYLSETIGASNDADVVNQIMADLRHGAIPNVTINY